MRRCRLYKTLDADGPIWRTEIEWDEFNLFVKDHATWDSGADWLRICGKATSWRDMRKLWYPEARG